MEEREARFHRDGDGSSAHPHHYLIVMKAKSLLGCKDGEGQRNLRRKDDDEYWRLLLSIPNLFRRVHRVPIQAQYHISNRFQ